jgi:hypothetical protein
LPAAPPAAQYLGTGNGSQTVGGEILNISGIRAE